MTVSVVPFSTFVVKIVSRCNLNCSYCYMYNLQDRTYRDQPVKMSIEVAECMGRRISAHAQHHGLDAVHVILHGGEPLLAGMHYLDRLLEAIRRGLGSQVRAYISMQSNGVLLNDDWVDFLAMQEVGIGISYDGPKDYHDRFRLHHDGTGSYDEVIAGIESLKKHPRGKEIFSTVMSVVDTDLDPRKAWADFKSLGIYGFDFSLPHANHRHQPKAGKWSYRDWLINLFDLWFDDPEPHGLRYFENIIRGIFKYPYSTDNIGGKPVGVLVVETNGDYEGTDALKCTEEGMSKLGRNVLRDEIDSLYEYPMVARLQQANVPLCETCQACPASEVCGGGYVPHRYHSEEVGVLKPGFENPTVYCDALYGLVEHAYYRVLETLPSEWIAKLKVGLCDGSPSRDTSAEAADAC